MSNVAFVPYVQLICTNCGHLATVSPTVGYPLPDPTVASTPGVAQCRTFGCVNYGLAGAYTIPVIQCPTS